MIRPIDLQSTLFAVQNSPAVARAEPGQQRAEAQAAQSAFAAELARKDEELGAADELAGNRIDAKDGSADGSDERQRGRHARKAATPFESMVDEAAGATEEPVHIVDCTA
jgi:hypothetical protein